MQSLLVYVNPVHNWDRLATGLNFGVSLVVKFFINCFDCDHLEIPRLRGRREVGAGHGECLDEQSKRVQVQICFKYANYIL